MKDKIFFSIVSGFIVGVFLCSFFLLNSYLGILLCVISFGIIFFYNFVSPRRSRTTGSKNKWGILAGIFVLAFSFGIFRFNIAEKNIEVLDLWSGKNATLGQSVSLSGMVEEIPEIKENNQKLVVGIGEGRNTKILITTDFSEEYRYGDIVNFYGKLQKPENFTTDTGKEFDYINYLKKDGIFYVMGYPKIEISTRDNGNKIKSTLFNIRNKFLEKIDQNINNPENLLMGAYPRREVSF